MLKLKAKNDYFFEAQGCGSPITLLRGQKTKSHRNRCKADGLLFRPGNRQATWEIWQRKTREKRFRGNPNQRRSGTTKNKLAHNMSIVKSREGGGRLPYTVFSSDFRSPKPRGRPSTLLGWRTAIDVHIRFSNTTAVVSGFLKPRFSKASTSGLWLNVNP